MHHKGLYFRFLAEEHTAQQFLATDGSTVSYTYDELNQLVGEVYSDGRVRNYTYDSRGNLLRKDDGFTQTEYTYDTVWADRLTGVGGTNGIVYDEIGNPTQWYNGAVMSWQHGRQLAGYTDETYTISYAYNADGIRTAKTVNNVTTTYTVVDGTLRRLVSGTNTLQFVNGTSVIFNDTEYWYVYNAQGDVVGLIDATGTYVVRYIYDAWGKPLSKTGSLADTLGTLNPFRYRGYVYDEETGLYYCISRYYDPEVGRFINADDSAVVMATPETPHWNKNLFVYCDNNPVIRIDSSGYVWETVFDVITIAISIVEVCIDPYEPLNWVGLGADLIDLIPFVTGVGEIARASKYANAAMEVASLADEAIVVADDIISVADDAVASAGDAARKIDFYVTPQGEVFPASMERFNANLSLLDCKNGKYIGEDVNGPLRIRVNEQHLDDPNFSGIPNSLHTELHFHFDRREKIYTGKWGKTYTGPVQMLW